MKLREWENPVGKPLTSNQPGYHANKFADTWTLEENLLLYSGAFKQLKVPARFFKKQYIDIFVSLINVNVNVYYKIIV